MTPWELVIDGCIRSYVALQKPTLTLKWVIGEITRSPLRGNFLATLLKTTEMKYVKDNKSSMRFNEIKQGCFNLGYF